VKTAAVAPGQQMTFRLRARDFDDVNGPNVAETPETSFRIVTRDELLTELARREQEFRLDFERLLKQQEQLRGELLTALSRFEQLDAGGLAALLSPLERRQRSIAGSVNVIRQQFEQILTELRINQLVTAAAEMRLGGQIVEPLTELARRDLVIAADTIRRWSRDASGETGSDVDPQQVAILQQMREILASMIQWEGYQEAVNTLRDILRMQSELESETQRAVEDQAGDIFNEPKP
jgi:ABC-type transporter Mla MlaB component